jgi:hypothetical protein
MQTIGKAIKWKTATDKQENHRLERKLAIEGGETVLHPIPCMQLDCNN